MVRLNEEIYVLFDTFERFIIIPTSSVGDPVSKAIQIGQLIEISLLECGSLKSTFKQ